MNYKATAFVLSALIAFVGCNDSKKEQHTTQPHKAPKHLKIVPVKEVAKAEEVKVKKVYTIDEIYNNMCIECHSTDGSGNTEKLTPSMVGHSEKDIREALLEVEQDKGHVIMEHNREQILKKGMEYSADAMASYMYKRFNK
jgi:mono/diheme cytochrome c family protein